MCKVRLKLELSRERLLDSNFLLPLEIDEGREEKGGGKSGNDAKEDRGSDEPGMGEVLLGEDIHSKEEEDDAIAGRCDCLHSILHRCEALLANILERVVLGGHPVCDEAYDSGPVNNE